MPSKAPPVRVERTPTGYEAGVLSLELRGLCKWRGEVAIVVTNSNHPDPAKKVVVQLRENPVEPHGSAGFLLFMLYILRQSLP